MRRPSAVFFFLMLSFFFDLFFCLVSSVYVVCRRGNNSQLAVERMRTLLPSDWPVVVKDIVGGLQAWAEQVDPLFPTY